MYFILCNSKLMKSSDGKILKFKSERAVKKEVKALRSVHKDQIDAYNIQISHLWSQVKPRREMFNELALLQPPGYKDSMAWLEELIAKTEGELENLYAILRKLESKKYRAVKFV